MKKTITSEVIIHATPERIWKVLTAFSGYKDWNPFIRFVEGNVAVGNKIKVRIAPPDAKRMTFKPEVLSYQPNKELTWVGQLFIPGLFDGIHKFELIDNGNNTTTFRQSESFKGILVSLLAKQLDGNTKKGFIAMNKKLKNIVEQS